MNLNEKTINQNDYSYLNFELINDNTKNNYNHNLNDNYGGINDLKNLTTHIIFKKSSNQIKNNKSQQASCTVLGKFNLFLQFYLLFFFC